MWLSFLLFLFLWPFTFVSAKENPPKNVTVVKIKQKNSLSAGVELSQLSSSRSSLQGMGFALRFSHALASKTSLSVSLSQHLGTGSSSSTSVLYSSFSGQIHYAITGRFDQEEEKIMVNEKEVFRRLQGQQTGWIVGLSLDQLFLNGESNVVPATGLSILGGYQTQLWGFDIKPELGYGQLTAKENESLTILRFGLRIGFSL